MTFNNFRSRVTRAASVACALALPGFGTALAMATPVFDLQLESSAAYSSSLTTSPTSTDTYAAPSVAAWAADGRNQLVDVFVVPALTTVPGFGVDLARAWTRFEQAPNGNSSVHAFARSSGYYFNDSAGNFARSQVWLRQTVRVENLGGHVAEVRLAQTTHGYLLSGGQANAATASAQEQITINGTCTNCYNAIGYQPAQIVMGWLGEATVFGDGLTAGFNVGGAWSGQHHGVDAQIPGFNGPIAGIELHALVISEPLFLNHGGVADLDVIYQAWFHVDTLGVESGFLSFGEADFANTGTLNWLVSDPVTGAPAADVFIHILGDTDNPATGLPVPGTAALVLLAGPLLAAVPTGLGARSRRRHRPSRSADPIRSTGVRSGLRGASAQSMVVAT